jgi:hypothetical protein
MKQLYDKAIYDFNTPIKSYWEDVSHFDQSRFPKLETTHVMYVLLEVVLQESVPLTTLQRNMAGTLNSLKQDILDLQVVEEMQVFAAFHQQNYLLTS